MLFEACKGILAADIARQAGLSLQQKGRRLWTCCPLHGEKTSSLMFDEAGNWHCFGCNKGGDAVDLYSALHNIPPFEAAQAISQGAGIQWYSGFTAKPPLSPGKQLKEKAEGWYWDQWDRCCKILHATKKMILDASEARQKAQEADIPYTLPIMFYEWVRVWSAAEQRLDVLLLTQCEPNKILNMMLEEQDEDATTGRGV